MAEDVPALLDDEPDSPMAAEAGPDPSASPAHRATVVERRGDHAEHVVAIDRLLGADLMLERKPCDPPRTGP